MDIARSTDRFAEIRDNVRRLCQDFPGEYWRKLEKHYYQSQKEVLTKMHDALLQAIDGRLP